MIAGRSASARSFAASSMEAVGSDPSPLPREADTSGVEGSDPGSWYSAALKTVSSGKSRKVGPEGWDIERSIASATRAAISAVSFTVAADLTSGSTNGTWSISWSEPEAPAHLGSAPAQDRDRRAVVERAGDRAHAVRDARAGGERGDTWLAGRLRVALGRPDRGLLVADVDDLDALLLAAVVDREEVPAGQA